MAQLLQGTYKLRNPEKYKGDPSNIIYRSSWELSMLSKLDTDANVRLFSSEEVVIPYRSPLDRRVHRYFVDFFVEYVDGTKVLIEVKPKSQTTPPTRTPKKREKTFIREAMTYAVNDAKWKAAEEYCAKRGWKFLVYTEDHLGLGKRY